MTRLALAAFALGCIGSAAAARTPKPVSSADYCPFVIETATRIVGPTADDYSTLDDADDGCVKKGASVGGIVYGDVVGLDPMPRETIACEAPGWNIRIGQNPPRAPTEFVIQLAFGPEHHGARRFWAQILHSNWRDDIAKGRIVAPGWVGCGPVDGVVTRHGDHWVAKTIPKKEPLGRVRKRAAAEQ